VRSGKSEAKVTNNRIVCSRYCTTEANDRRTRSIARPVCNSRAYCCFCVCSFWLKFWLWGMQLLTIVNFGCVCFSGCSRLMKAAVQDLHSR